MFFIQRHSHTTLRCYAGFQRFTGIKKTASFAGGFLKSNTNIVLCIFIRVLDLLGQQY